MTPDCQRLKMLPAVAGLVGNLIQLLLRGSIHLPRHLCLRTCHSSNLQDLQEGGILHQLQSSGVSVFWSGRTKV